MAEKPWGSHFKLKCYPIDARDEFIYTTDLTKGISVVFQKGINGLTLMNINNDFSAFKIDTDIFINENMNNNFSLFAPKNMIIAEYYGFNLPLFILN